MAKRKGKTPARMPKVPAPSAPEKEAPSAPSQQRAKKRARAIDPELLALDAKIDANRAAGRPWWEGTRYGPDDDPLLVGREPQPDGGAYVHEGDRR
jgi:hypothetical protein